MVAFISALSLLLFASSSAAVPVGNHQFPPVPVTTKGLLCSIPIPIVHNLLCPRQGTSSPVIVTTLGAASGVIGTNNVARYSVRYGTAARWQPSSVAKVWQLPNGLQNASSLPLACPQDGVDSSSMSEDCLSMILYVPRTVKIGSNSPTMLWIHGGSFTSGSATGPGMDGSNFAAATNSIVAVVQYRLGALGFMGPDNTTNFALGDIITSLQFLKKVLPAFGGSASKITVAGQSAGGTMIRGLLASPAASSLFQSAILQSDPMDYGFLSPGAQQTLQNYFNGLFSCQSSNATCWNQLSIQDILSAQDNLVNAATAVEPSAGPGEPIRVVRDGSLITTTLTDSSPFPTVSKPVLISTVKNDGAYTIYSGIRTNLDTATYEILVEQTFGQPDSSYVLQNPNYAISSSLAKDPNADVRPTLELLGTDQVWRCPGWTFARNWVGHGGKAYVGQYVVGASYPGNEDVNYCTQPGVVCHQDDIMIVFGTVPNPNAQQAALIKEVQARYKAFMNNGNPNVAGYATWNAATTSDVHALNLGGSGETPAGGCDPNFFGKLVLYDYQKFGA